MKTKITIATLLFGFTVNAQLEKFEGLWHSEDTTYKTLITHDNRNDFIAINTFSFEDNTLVVESIKSIFENEITTIAVSEDGWNLLVKYIVINDTIMKATLTGSASTTLVFRKLLD